MVYWCLYKYRYLDELARVKKLPDVQEKMRKFDGYLEELRETVGRKSKLSLDDILLLHNNLDIEKRMNLTMLPWMKDVLANERLIEMRKLYYEITSYTDLLKRLLSGTQQPCTSYLCLSLLSVL